MYFTPQTLKPGCGPDAFKLSRGFAFVPGGWHSKIGKKRQWFSVSYFNLGGLDLCLGG